MNVSATALTALAAAQQQLDRSAEGIRQAALPEGGQDHLELSEEVAGLLAARTSYRVAIELAKLADETAVVSLDLLA
ncbi:MAG: hypothetical protein O2968_21415 [Acidobacteria bacterium]|nr:hypothetical protein [Acidobacteriota bacterium]